MSPRTLALFVLTLLAAGPAHAQDKDKMRHIRYQDALLARSLDSTNKAYCDGKLGEESASNKTEYDKCHVTRLFLVDLTDGTNQGFPPMVEIKYSRSKAEMNMIVKALP